LFNRLIFSDTDYPIVTGARRDKDGYLWVTGRIDDMLNVSGHLISTAEVESALIEHSSVAENAVVARPHPIKGECLHCFVTLKDVNILFVNWLVFLMICLKQLLFIQIIYVLEL